MTENPSPEQDNSKPKATRNILLIRHSQYNLSGISDKERILTPLGYFSLHQSGEHRSSVLHRDMSSPFPLGSGDLCVSHFQVVSRPS